MKPSRGRLLLAVFGVLAAVTPALPARASVPQLAGTTVVTGSRPAMMRVSVPRAATYSFDWRQSMSVGGPGEIVGVRFLEDAQVPARTDARFLRYPAVTGRYDVTGTPAASRRVCRPGADPTQPQVCTVENSGRGRLRRGTYWMQLLTDGAPVTVTLRFDLPGRVTLRPSTPMRYEVARLTRSLDGIGDGAAWFGGAATRVTKPTLALFASWWKEDNERYNGSQVCVYAATPADATMATSRWAYGCTLDSFSGSTNGYAVHADYGQSDTTRLEHLTGWSEVRPGEVNVALEVTGSNVRDVGGYAAWLEQPPLPEPA